MTDSLTAAAGPLWRAAGIDSARFKRIAEQLQIPERVAKWVCLRCPADTDPALWWGGTEFAWSSPYEFDEMQRLVEVTLSAVEKRVPICVVGDYDVDGVTASSILVTALQTIGADVFCLIPHRTQDGYGLSNKLVDRARARGAAVLLTVDNGIRAHEAIAYAAACGLTVLVTDHHEPDDGLPPDASAVVHWRRCTSPGLSLLCGAGVALKTAMALLDAAGISGSRRNSLDSWFLALASLGTLADLVPLQGENRQIVTRGLSVLQESTHAGWQALCSVAGVTAVRLDDSSLTWHITPRINAAGRMDTAEIAFQLLMTSDDTDLAAELAEQIERLNQRRRSETDQAIREALAMCQEKYTTMPAAIVVAGPWNLGIVGIVAAKLSDTYGCPALVFADDGGPMWRGSGRAPEGMFLHSAVERCQSFLVNFGGHESAIGCAVTPSLVPTFEVAFQTAVRDLSLEAKPSESVDPPIADDVLPLSEATLETISWLERFRPFGAANPPLVFYVGPVTIQEVRWVGGGKHLRGRVTEGRYAVSLIWFNAADEARAWRTGSVVSLVVQLEENAWQNTRIPQLRVIEGHLLERPIMRDEFSLLYRLLQSRRKLLEHEACEVLPHRQVSEVAMVFDTFVELGFAERHETAYHVVEQATVRDLRDSLCYQQHLRTRALGTKSRKRMGQGETT